LRRSHLKEKVDAGRTDGRRTLRHGISSHGLRPGELTIESATWLSQLCFSPSW